MGGFGNVRGSVLSSSNGPHWLIGDDHSVPVLYAILNCFKLGLQMIIGLSSFSLLKAFADADDAVEPNVLSLGDLLGYGLVVISEDIPSLRVTKNDPLDAKISELISADFSGVGSISLRAHVLSRNNDVILHECLDGGDVDENRRDQDVVLRLIELGFVQ